MLSTIYKQRWNADIESPCNSTRRRTVDATSPHLPSLFYLFSLWCSFKSACFACHTVTFKRSKAKESGEVVLSLDLTLVCQESEKSRKHLVGHITPKRRLTQVDSSGWQTGETNVIANDSNLTTQVIKPSRKDCQAKRNSRNHIRFCPARKKANKNIQKPKTTLNMMSFYIGFTSVNNGWGMFRWPIEGLGP